MAEFWGIVRYEYRMSIRRWGVLLAFGLICLPYLWAMFASPGNLETPTEITWSMVAGLPFQLNLFMPVVAGIAAADRLVRDDRVKMRELLSSTPLRTGNYLLGKYLGVLLSMLTPVALFSVFLGLIAVAVGTPLVMVPMLAVAFLAIAVPAYAFVVAFSLVCPLIMPVRVYQVLFTGYWFWGNYLNGERFLTLSGTWLTPCGKLIYQGYFSGTWSTRVEGYTPFDATMSLITLGLCAAIALAAGAWYLARQARQA